MLTRSATIAEHLQDVEAPRIGRFKHHQLWVSQMSIAWRGTLSNLGEPPGATGASRTRCTGYWTSLSGKMAVVFAGSWRWETCCPCPYRTQFVAPRANDQTWHQGQAAQGWLERELLAQGGLASLC